MSPVSVSPGQTMATQLLLAVALGACGALVLPYSLFQSGAVPLFVAGGVAIAALATHGMRLLPAVAAGAILLEWLGTGHFPRGATLLMAPVTAMAQAAMGAVLLRRQGDPALASSRSVLHFLGVALATGMLSALLFAGAHGGGSASSFQAEWLLWGMVDTIGVLVGAPLCWIFIGRPRALWQARLAMLGLPLALAFGVAFSMCYQVYAWEQAQLRVLFQMKATQIGDLLQFQFDEHQRFLYAVSRVFDESNIDSQEKFSRLARGYLDRRPELRLMSLARRVERSERSAFESWAGKTVRPGFTITDISGRAFRPSSVRPEYLATTYVEPMEENQKVVGMDLLSEPLRAAMAETALAGRQAVASAPLKLAQTNFSGAGILLAQRVQSAGSEGLLVVVLEVVPYLHRTIGAAALALRFEDISGARLAPMVDELTANAQGASVVRQLSLGGRSYRLTLDNQDAAIRQPGLQSWAVLVASLLLVGMIAAFLLRLTGQRADMAALNHALGHSLERLRQTQDELINNAKLAALGALVTGVAHELNTPIGNSLLTASAMGDAAASLQKSVAGEGGVKRSALEAYFKQCEAASAMLMRSLGRASDLITQFKEVAVNQRGERRCRFALAQIVDDALQMTARALSEGHIVVERELAPDIMLDSYPSPLRQVVLAIVQNALAHAFPEGGGGAIRIAASLHAPGRVCLSISDNGQGIAEANLGHVFDPFFTTKLGSGTGLGLSIAHNIVTGILGGEIRADSAPGKGASFIVDLPLVAPARQ